MSDSRWYFTEEQLANSPSRKCGINAEQELSYRQRAANLIQEMGQRLQVSQLCINTGIVYMHRFYAFHSFTLFHRNSIAAAAFFLAAKVEEQPRKLEHVIKILNICLDKSDNTRESYTEQAQELVFNENVLLQTLGFDVAIDHPHTHVVRACQLFNIVTVSRELRQTCYFMASNSLHLTTMCLKYRPTVVAAFCIYIACKWSRWEIPNSSEGKAWYSYVDENVTVDNLKKLTDEYLQILERSPSKFKSKMKAITSNGQTALNTNPSVHGRDDVPLATSSHHKSHHEKHHHHHQSSRNSSGSTTNNVNRKQTGDVTAITTTSSSVKEASQASASSSSYNNKNQTMPPIGPSNSHTQRQRPSTGSQHPPYSETAAKPISNEDRTQHRSINQENTSFNVSAKQNDYQRQRTSSSQVSTLTSSQSSHSQQKPINHDQRHSQTSKQSMIMKQPTSSSTGSEIQNRSNASHQLQQQQQQHKKPSWTQQTSHQSNLQKPAQSHVQPSHSQPNLNSSSSNRSSTSQTLPSYNESTKQSSSQPTQNDYWFNNDKLSDSAPKVLSPIRPVKSMFSPSPEHDAFDRTKLTMTATAKRNESPKTEKQQDRQTSTPSKREKRAEATATPVSQKSSQQDRKQPIPKPDNTNVPPLIPDSKKRPFSTMDDGEFTRDHKARKVDSIKSESAHLTGAMMKQPIETNPDIVKSLLQECYTTSKFDSFGMDSPLDVIGTDASSTQPLIDSLKTELNDSITSKLELKDNGYDEAHEKKNKSKKKKDKDKHRHKKKKSHKSDREDRKDPSLKIVLSKDKSESKSSPESVHTPGGLKIKIPIKDVNKTDLTGVSSLPPAPLKLKISKEKMGNFNNLSDGGSTSSSSHKKKEKDRSKSKSSKHGSNNNNNSDFKDVGHQHQQMPINKMNLQVPMLHQQQQQQQQQQFQGSRFVNSEPIPQTQIPFGDLPSMFGANNFPQTGFFQHQQQPISNPQQQQQQDYHSFNDFFHHSNMNYNNVGNSQNSGKK